MPARFQGIDTSSAAFLCMTPSSWSCVPAFGIDGSAAGLCSRPGLRIPSWEVLVVCSSSHSLEMHGWLSIPAATMSVQSPFVWLLSFALAVLLSFLDCVGPASSRALLPKGDTEPVFRIQAFRPRSAGGRCRWKRFSSKIIPRSTLCINHSMETILIPHSPAYVYFGPDGTLAIRCVTSFVRLPRYCPPFSLIKSSSSFR